MKMIKNLIPLAVAVVIFAALDVQAYFDPTIGVFCSRDPMGEPGFEVLHAASSVPQVGQVVSPASLPPGRFAARDPIAEIKSPLYEFARNNPNNFFDPLGEDFIAVGERPVWLTLGFESHMSIEFYKQPCPSAKVGEKFTPSDIGKGDFAGASRAWQWELLPDFTDYGWVYENPYYGSGIFEPPNNVINAGVSFIHPSSNAKHLVVIYADGTIGDSASQWRKISLAARSYPYAEQLPLGHPLQRWPNSEYQLPPGNNSNTFIDSMAAVIGANASGLFSDTPGATTPSPVNPPHAGTPQPLY